MNVSFHVLSGIAAAALLSGQAAGAARIAVVAGFGIAVALHSLLDFVPHSYPIPSVPDAVLALGLTSAALFLARARARLLLVACLLGSVAPDVIDLAPGILNRHLGLHMTEAHHFPWHWRKHSGSVYDGSRAIQSAVSHLLVVALAGFSAWRRRDLFARVAEPKRP